MADQILFMQQRITLNDADGTPLAGGSVTFYRTGTTTLVDIYSDSAASVALDNPVTADASGRIVQVFYSDTYEVKAVIRDSSGSMVDVIDPCPLWDSSSALTGSSLAVTGAITGASVTVTGDVKTDSAGSVEWELDKGGSTFLSRIWGLSGGKRRWASDYGDATAESGAEVGSDYALKRYDDDGNFIDNAFRIFRDDGQGIFYGEFVAPWFGFQTTAGVGDTVTQATDKTTAVTLNKRSGTIVTTADSLGANTTVRFTLTNSLILARTIVWVQIVSPTSKYFVNVSFVTAGSAQLALRNDTGGSLSEAVTIRFGLFDGADD